MYLHSIGVLHGDIKPSSFGVGVAQNGTPSAKEIDFGSAKLIGRQLKGGVGLFADMLQFRCPEVAHLPRGAMHSVVSNS